jgi:hypothetical protein
VARPSCVAAGSALTMSRLLRAADISSTSREGVYDCLYVALAEREGCELVTADSRLLATFKTTFPFIIDLASLPGWEPPSPQDRALSVPPNHRTH